MDAAETLGTPRAVISQYFASSTSYFSGIRGVRVQSAMRDVSTVAPVGIWMICGQRSSLRFFTRTLKKNLRAMTDHLNERITRLDVASDCQIAAAHRRSAMSKQTRKHDFGGKPSIGKPRRDTSRLEDISAKQRKQHAHKAPVRRAASKFRG
jgi:hypothetical protein